MIHSLISSGRLSWQFQRGESRNRGAVCDVATKGLLLINSNFAKTVKTQFCHTESVAPVVFIRAKKSFPLAKKKSDSQ